MTKQFFIRAIRDIRGFSHRGYREYPETAVSILKSVLRAVTYRRGLLTTDNADGTDKEGSRGGVLEF